MIHKIKSGVKACKSFEDPGSSKNSRGRVLQEFYEIRSVDSEGRGPSKRYQM